MHTQPQRPTQVILWSQGRTACHLLERMLSNQADTTYLWHPFVPARPKQIECFRNASAAHGIPTQVREPYEDEVQKGITIWTEALDKAQTEGRTLFVHEHPQFGVKWERGLMQAAATPSELLAIAKARTQASNAENFTMVPDTLMLQPGTAVILTFRHPAVLVPAAWRALTSMEVSSSTSDRSNMLLVGGLQWQRELYDWYFSHGITPVVAEAEDYMTDEAVTKKIASTIGFDPQRALFKWEKMSEDDQAALPPLVADLMRSLNNSAGLDASKVKQVGSLDNEAEKWKEEFGVEIGAWLRELADAAMPDYKHLRERKTGR